MGWMEEIEMSVTLYRHDFASLVLLLEALYKGESERFTPDYGAHYDFELEEWTEDPSNCFEPNDPLYLPDTLGWIAFLYKELGITERDGRTRRSRKGWYTVNVCNLGLVQWRRGNNRLGELGAWFTIRINGEPVLTCDPMENPDLLGDELHRDYLRKGAEAGSEVARRLLETAEAFASVTKPLWHKCPEASDRLGQLFARETVD